MIRRRGIGDEGDQGGRHSQRTGLLVLQRYVWPKPHVPVTRGSRSCLRSLDGCGGIAARLTREMAGHLAVCLAVAKRNFASPVLGRPAVNQDILKATSWAMLDRRALGCCFQMTRDDCLQSH
jgi:hypothetical protein